ncbi:flagellin [Brevibacillus borstelensis]|uniref:Flagellin n=1 Tax=Brevibacillus borstelensis AK1 TaxID=1300222 RepID=M8E9T0_9BACL|nr:flagellin [Brevibacillus borstelensis]EMT52255.1 flagellin [Brevibacillus borstelensis AK1]KKX54701.1 flagellin [Brevibacillus borstelensis cifa_chp40]MED1881771.1 flagellin [Brevibacillus borstelensis]RNB59128.1 flagellin [Brevibacillus borstelensis]GED55003.1 flagellin [Brevibacillus borstelensis]
MIINHNISAMNTHRQLGVNTGSLAKNVEKLSSGYRINRAADDAAGLSISERMRAQIRGMEQASRNSQDGISLIQTAEGALQTVNNMLVRIKEIATQSANGTYGDDADRARLQEELSELTKEIKNIKDNTTFNGIHLLNGNSGKDIKLQIGEAAGQVLTLTVSSFNLSAVATAVSGWDIGSQGGASAVLGAIETQINNVSKARSYLGANQNRLENTINNLNITSENLTAAESRIRDVDMAKEQMQFTKNNILTQASQAMLAQANQLPQGVLQLLR